MNSAKAVWVPMVSGCRECQQIEDWRKDYPQWKCARPNFVLMSVRSDHGVLVYANGRHKSHRPVLTEKDLV